MTKAELRKDIEQILEIHSLWVIKNVEHGIYLPLPSPQATQKLLQKIDTYVDYVIGFEPTYMLTSRNANDPKISTQIDARVKLRAEQHQRASVDRGGKQE